MKKGHISKDYSQLFGCLSGDLETFFGERTIGRLRGFATSMKASALTRELEQEVFCLRLLICAMCVEIVPA
jgi:hypothetical protein